MTAILLLWVKVKKETLPQKMVDNVVWEEKKEQQKREQFMHDGLYPSKFSYLGWIGYCWKKLANI